MHRLARAVEKLKTSEAVLMYMYLKMYKIPETYQVHIFNNTYFLVSLPGSSDSPRFKTGFRFEALCLCLKFRRPRHKNIS